MRSKPLRQLKVFLFHKEKQLLHSFSSPVQQNSPEILLMRRRTRKLQRVLQLSLTEGSLLGILTKEKS
jgi:hypothetical protein